MTRGLQKPFLNKFGNAFLNRFQCSNTNLDVLKSVMLTSSHQSQSMTSMRHLPNLLKRKKRISFFFLFFKKKRWITFFLTLTLFVMPLSWSQCRSNVSASTMLSDVAAELAILALSERLVRLLIQKRLISASGHFQSSIAFKSTAVRNLLHTKIYCRST